MLPPVRIPAFRPGCTLSATRLETLQHEATEDISVNELEALKMESDTWALLQALMSYVPPPPRIHPSIPPQTRPRRRLRKTTPPEHPHPRALLAENPYTPPAALAQSIMHASPLLSALVVVREWLHDSAPAPPAPGATNGYWRFTRNAVLQGRRTGRPGAGLVEEMDPDAADRVAGDEGRNLAPDDAVSLWPLGCCVCAAPSSFL